MKLFGSGQNALMRRQRRIRRYFDPFSGPFQSMVQRGSVRFFTFRIDAGQDEIDSTARTAMQTAMLFAGFQPQAAIPQLETLAKKFPDNPHVLGHYGQALCAAHRTEDALEVLANARALAPRDTGILAAIGQAERIRDDFAEALSYPEVLIPKRDVYARDLFQRAQILHESNPELARRYAQVIAEHTTDRDLKSRANVFLHLFELTADTSPKKNASEPQQLPGDSGNVDDGAAKRLLSLLVALQGVRTSPTPPGSEAAEPSAAEAEPSSESDVAAGLRKQLESLADVDPVTQFIRHGIRCNQAGQYGDAAEAYRTALAYDHEQVDALNNLAWLYATCPHEAQRNANEALRLAAKACRINGWCEASTLDTLAAAFAESGAFEQAIRYEERALAAVSEDDGDRQERYRESLRSYERGVPTRDPRLS